MNNEDDILGENDRLYVMFLSILNNEDVKVDYSLITSQILDFIEIEAMTNDEAKDIFNSIPSLFSDIFSKLFPNIEIHAIILTLDQQERRKYSAISTMLEVAIDRARKLGKTVNDNDLSLHVMTKKNSDAIQKMEDHYILRKYANPGFENGIRKIDTDLKMFEITGYLEFEEYKIFKGITNTNLINRVIYTLQEIREWLLELSGSGQQDIAKIPEPKKFQWVAGPAKFGFIFSELVERGYLEKPASSNLKDAEFYLQHFNISVKKSNGDSACTTPGTLAKELGSTNSLSINTLELLKIPDANKF